MTEEITLSTLKPAQKRKARKRVGRGLASGKGRYSGRGIKGQKSRAGSHAMRAGFEGGQMPLYMRLGKQRGNTSKDAMPVGPHRTYTQPVNLRDLDKAFADGAEVTLETLLAAGLVNHLRHDVKILGDGELTKKLTVSAHRFSRVAREKIEAAGGSIVELRPGRAGAAEAAQPVEAPAPADEPVAEASDDVEAQEPAVDDAAE